MSRPWRLYFLSYDLDSDNTGEVRLRTLFFLGHSASVRVLETL